MSNIIMLWKTLDIGRHVFVSWRNSTPKHGACGEATNKHTEPTSFVPSNPICDNILKGFNSEEKSDVKFEVDGETKSTANRRKRLKTSSTIFHASHWILDLNAPALADMCRPGDEAVVPINGVDPDVFKMVLYFCYGGTIEEEELAANAKPIIDAADRFGT